MRVRVRLQQTQIRRNEPLLMAESLQSPGLSYNDGY
jgi:hypothetical protein